MHHRRTLTRNMSVLAILLVFAAVPWTQVSAEIDFSIVSTDQLKSMMDRQETFTLIDARTKEEFEDAHIPEAISIPEKSFDEHVSLLPADKGSLIVFYCNGVKCGKSKRSAKKASALGYTNIATYNDGFPVWEEKNLKIVPGPGHGKKIETTKLKPGEVKRLIDGDRGQYVLVDVRDEAEYREGHIPTAINIPAENFASKQDILPKEKKIIVYCNTGGRSYMAYRKLVKMDYKNIFQTTLADWKEAGMPVE